MGRYEQGSIERLATRMEEADVPPEVAARVLEGGEAIQRKATPEARAAWWKGAMERMDLLLGEEERQAVRQACACCLGGKRHQVSRSIARENATLEDRVRAANEARFVFGNGVTRQADGTLLVRFQPEGNGPYRCSCIPGVTETISITYCMCCAGHVRHHLRVALGRELSVRVRSSALSTGGERPCTFVATLAG
ncbi:MAG: hypothetical protein IT208_08405 [Chthonomonadales bacterium]|nr:hypothetical protein [Chthonomonadales bacterium]